MTRVVARAFAGGKKIFEELLTLPDEGFEGALVQICDRHAAILAPHPRHMVELEFIDDPNPQERFYRIGTDPRGMRYPLIVLRGR